MLDALFLVPFVDKGHWPVAGGVLDQTDTFIEACEIVWTEQARWKEKWRKEAESREK